jgi:SnoaL-like domain
MPSAKSILTGLCSLLAIAMWVTADAPRAANTPALTARDYVEIQQLANSYAYALDTGANQGRMYADLFTADGIFGRAKGRDDLIKLAWQHMPEQGPQYGKHFIQNHVIESTPNGIIGKQYLVDMMFDDTGRSGVVSAAGVYHDEYMKAPEGWRFKVRRFVASKAGPQAAPIEPTLQIELQPLVDPSNRSGSTKTTLTSEDYLEIQELVNRYPYALDTGAGNGRMYGNLFTADGVFGRLTGREAITKMAWEHMPEQGPRYAKHFLANHVIHATGDEVTGREYVLVLAVGEGGKATSITTGGLYEDVYEKTPSGWRFKSRRFAGTKAPFQPNLPVLPPSGSQVEGALRGGSNSLSALDHLQIRQLVSETAYAIDSGTQNGQLYADLFTSDGVFKAEGRQYRGATELAELARRERQPGTLHIISNHLITASPSGATGKSYLGEVSLGDGGQPKRVVGGGHFEDEYVRTPRGWRVKARTYYPSKTGTIAQ